jgi:hypothetical protein
MESIALIIEQQQPAASDGLTIKRRYKVLEVPKRQKAVQTGSSKDSVDRSSRCKAQDAHWLHERPCRLLEGSTELKSSESHPNGQIEGPPVTKLEPD